MKRNQLMLLVWNEHRRIKHNRNIKRFSDKEAVCRLYFNAFGVYPNLENPKTYNEKLQWLKLNYRDPSMVICADKYKAREYLKKRGYEYLLNDLHGVYERIEELDISKLPERFILKATHGSNMNLIVKDKKRINWFIWKRIMKSWLLQNISVEGREWVYNYIKPRIVCEKYLEDSSGQLTDYKFFCFNGRPEFIQADFGRFADHRRNMYDTRWKLLPFTFNYPNLDQEVEPPGNLDEMKKTAQKLSEGFPHVRIDFYNVKGKIFFGEFTFFPESGTGIFNPGEYDYKIGEFLSIQLKGR